MHASLFVAALVAAAGPAAAWPGMTPGAAGAAAHGSHHARFHNTDMYKEIVRAAAVAEAQEKKLLARGQSHGQVAVPPGNPCKMPPSQPTTTSTQKITTSTSTSSISSSSISTSSTSTSSVSTSSTSTSFISTMSTSTSSTSTTSATPSPASCSVWAQVGKAVQPSFRDGNGCSALARGAIRLGFHDAGAWNTSVAWGGADGSILLNASELARSENAGLGDIATQTIAWYNQWKGQGVGMADLIQFSAIVATVTCPLGPRVQFYAGRADDARAAVDGLLPSAFDTAPNLIALFQAKTFSAADLVALVGAHSTSQQFFTDPAEAGDAQDSTPGVWDTKFYAETAQRTAPAGVYRFPSDVALAGDSQTSGTWRAMNNQRRWDTAYADAYFRMSLLGVDNVDSLVDCTASIP
ncbi:hypothetical protein SCUCBS95973_007384 [Sporothrix curviconia]|uniref:Peroxidase n=1 Tax=Sporothrix curviconia TaxID=1260050 RepID=A0ABP0CDK0_9PEZI